MKNMGIVSSLLTKVGLPIAAIVAGGILLSKFKDPIIEQASNVGNVIGQSITAPIAGLTQGLGEGLANIKLPEFNFDNIVQSNASTIRSPPDQTNLDLQPDPNSPFTNAKSIRADECGNVFIDGVLKTGSGICNRNVPAQNAQPASKNGFGTAIPEALAGLFQGASIIPLAFGQQPTVKQETALPNNQLLPNIITDSGGVIDRSVFQATDGFGIP